MSEGWPEEVRRYWLQFCDSKEKILWLRLDQEGRIELSGGDWFDLSLPEPTPKQPLAQLLPWLQAMWPAQCATFLPAVQAGTDSAFDVHLWPAEEGRNWILLRDAREELGHRRMAAQARAELQHWKQIQQRQKARSLEPGLPFFSIVCRVSTEPSDEAKAGSRKAFHRVLSQAGGIVLLWAVHRAWAVLPASNSDLNGLKALQGIVAEASFAVGICLGSGEAHSLPDPREPGFELTGKAWERAERWCEQARDGQILAGGEFPWSAAGFDRTGEDAEWKWEVGS
ncbi:MAG: hypothetical protein DWQ01_11560 [Planctomycetota bacterium]|nr:MAG: hypothetical protein DWQ01_11560 [Planctomycetota bacterium]